MCYILVLLLGFALPSVAQGVAEEEVVKTKKLAEIDARIAEVERNLESLRSLRSAIASGSIPLLALDSIIIPGAQPATGPPPANERPAPFVGQVSGFDASPSKQASIPEPVPPKLVATPPASANTRPPVSQYHRGPRGGCYTITASGNKRYVDRSLCN